MRHMAQFTAEMKSNGPSAFLYVFTFEVKNCFKISNKMFIHFVFFFIYLLTDLSPF
jgi:hypothetical protein